MDNQPINPHRRYVQRLFVAVLLLAIWQFGTGCVTYERCLNKYGTLAKDSVEVPVTVLIPKDSTAVQFRYDTVTHTIIQKQGRATVIVQRFDSTFYVHAVCDTVTKTVTAHCPPAVSFADKAKDNWYWWLIGGLFGGLIIAFLLKR